MHIKKSNWRNTLINIVLILAIFKTPYIAIFVEFFEFDSTSIAISIRILIILIAIILFFLIGKMPIHKNYLIIIFLFIITFSVIFIQLSLNPELLLYRSYFYYFGFAFSILAYVTVIFISYDYLKNFDKTFFYNLFFISIIILLIGSDEINNRLSLRTLNPITIGYLAGILFLISFWKLYTSSNKRKISLIGLVLSFFLIIEANSKSPVIGILFGILSLFIIKKKLNFKILVSILFSFLTFFVLFFYFETRLFDYDLKSPSLYIRLSIWEVYYDAIIKNILLPMVHPVYTLNMSHNIFLSIYSGTGILGLIIFFYLIYFTLKASFKLIRFDNTHGWLGLIFILSLIRSMVSGGIIDESFWIFLSLVNVIYFKKRKKEIE